MIALSAILTEEDRNKFREIYEENYLKMYHVALGMIKNQADAENAVQEAFLSLAEKFEKYLHLSGSEMTGLCVSIVKNKIIDIIRRANHYSEEELDKLVLYDECKDHDAQAAVEKKEEKKFVHRALEKIPEVYREAMILKYCYGMDNHAIAKIQGVSVKTAEMRIFRGKVKFKEVWDETEG
ncbi:MAG: RNA polymerase sigma factor [Lachnospiraceae bacterium]|nr:RNA polymerase sigma factor [Lachnospiraceae bacterium]